MFLIILSGATALALIIILTVIIKSRIRRRDEAIMKAQDKMREEALDRMILNENAGVDVLRAQAERAFAVNYSQGGPRRSNEKRLMLQVEEISEFSVRKYMLDPANLITIGCVKENTIELPAGEADARQCEMGLQDGMVYLVNLGSGDRVWVTRKGKRKNADSRKLEIKDGDIIQIGRVTLKISFILAGEG
ncbi:MAG: FHA domain-containing protein [Lachnospiraceae bacterium]|nr:FHA domain-containing protein [Lachnospiraceae bacterium]